MASSEGCGRLRVEGHLAVAVEADLAHVLVPVLARVLAERLLRHAAQHVPGAFHVLGGERLAVMPLDAIAQLEGELGLVRVPRPAGGELRHDRIHAVLRLVLVVDDQIVEHPHHRGVGRDRWLPRGSKCRRESRGDTSAESRRAWAQPRRHPWALASVPERQRRRAPRSSEPRPAAWRACIPYRPPWRPACRSSAAALLFG